MIVGLLSDVHAHRDEHAIDIARLIDHVNSTPCPDLLIFAGDISHRTAEVEEFLTGIRQPCPKCWVPGNHDIWVVEQESPNDTPEHRYRTVFPKLSRKAGWHYLPQGPRLVSDTEVAVVGTLGWFTGEGYSEWFDGEASARDFELAARHALELEASIRQVPMETPLIVVTHHVGHCKVPSIDPTQGTVWSRVLQEVLVRYKERVLLVFHGHVHVRYGPVHVDGLRFVAHPFGYPHQHHDVHDGYRVLEVPTRSL